jgi:hypothetical protein
VGWACSGVWFSPCRYETFTPSGATTWEPGARPTTKPSRVDWTCTTFLIFAYPFYPLEGKREEIFSESLHDTFRQIEAEKVLRP